MIRFLVLRCGLGLVLFLGALIVIMPARAETTITVTTTSDVVASDGLCTLREAVIAANTDSPHNDCPGGSGADTIEFSASLPLPATFLLTNSGANEDSALTGDLDILGSLTINGAGTDQIIIDGNGTDRVFQIRPLAQVTISGVTLRNGDPGPGADGGAVLVDLTARLTLNNSIVISNAAATGGGIKVLGLLSATDSAVAGNQGGGIGNDGGGLVLSNVSVTDNSGGYGIENQNQAQMVFDGGAVSGNQGGGIHNADSSATLSNLNILSNTDGGGVFHSVTGVARYRLRLSHSTVMSNTAISGAGIRNEGVASEANIDNTRISYNVATAGGGGINNNGVLTLDNSTIDHNRARSGGGIDHSGSSLQMTNDTISSNTVSDNGGGLYNRSSATLTYVTLNGNGASGPDTGGNIFNDGDAAQLAIRNTIVAHAGPGGNCFNGGGLLNSLGHDLESADTCAFGAAGDFINTNPMLGPLRDNGGATYTHALLPGSPAIDEIPAADCGLATDQRGISRPQGAACDIGAYEFWSAVNLSIVKTVETTHTPVRLGEPITYTTVIANNGDVDATGVRVTDTLPVGVTGSHVDWTGIVTAGEQVTFTIPAAVTTSVAFFGQTITNTAYYSHSSGSGSDVVSFTIGTAVGPDLSGSSKTSAAAGQQVLPGALVTYTITLANSGGADANVTVTDALESHYVVFAATDFSEAPANTLVWQGSVPAGQQVTLHFVAQVVNMADLPIGTTVLSNSLWMSDGTNPVFSVPDVAPPFVEIYGVYLPLIVRDAPDN